MKEKEQPANNTGEIPPALKFNKGSKKYLRQFISEGGFNKYAVLLTVFLLRLILSFLLISFIDLPNYTEVGNYLNYGYNPYDLNNDTYPINFYRKYPPLFFELLAVWFRIFGNSALSLKLLFLLCDMITIYFLYLIGLGLKNERLGITYAFFYAFVPFNIIGFTYGENDSIPVMFTTIAIYFYLKHRYNMMYIFLGLGISFKIYPIFILWAFIIYFIRKKEYNETIKALLIPSAIFLILALPFFIISPQDFIGCMLVHFTRINTGISFYPLVLVLYEHSITFTINSISINLSLNSLIEISIFTIISLILLIPSFKGKKLQVKNTFPLRWSVFFLGLQPIFQHKGNMSLFTWLSPILIILLFYRTPDLLNKYGTRFYSIFIAYLIFIIALIVYNTQIPYNIFQSFGEMTGVVEYHREVLNVERTIRWIDYFKLFLFIPWIIIFIKIKEIKFRSLGAIFSLNLLDWTFFYLLNLPFDRESPVILVFYIYWGLRIIIILYIFSLFLTDRNFKVSFPRI